jgi:hypothetical protein
MYEEDRGMENTLIGYKLELVSHKLKNIHVIKLYYTLTLMIGNINNFLIKFTICFHNTSDQFNTTQEIVGKNKDLLLHLSNLILSFSFCPQAPNSMSQVSMATRSSHLQA